MFNTVAQAQDGKSLKFDEVTTLLYSTSSEQNVLGLSLNLATKKPVGMMVQILRLQNPLNAFWSKGSSEFGLPYVIHPINSTLQTSVPIIVGIPIPEGAFQHLEVVSAVFGGSSSGFFSVPTVLDAEKRLAYIAVYHSSMIQLLRRESSLEVVSGNLSQNCCGKNVPLPLQYTDSCDLDSWSEAIRILQPVGSDPLGELAAPYIGPLVQIMNAFQVQGFRPPVLERILTHVEHSLEGDLKVECAFGIHIGIQQGHETELGYFSPSINTLVVYRSKKWHGFGGISNDSFCRVFPRALGCWNLSTFISSLWRGHELEPPELEDEVIDDPIKQTIIHELFHSIQFSYPRIRNSSVDDINWSLEGTATLAGWSDWYSNEPPRLVRYFRFPRRELDEGLLVPSSVEDFNYRTQDFWYDLIKRQLQSESQGKFNYLHQMLEAGAMTATGLNTFLEKRGSSLPRAYLSWVLHQVRQAENFENTRPFNYPKTCEVLEGSNNTFRGDFPATRSQALRTVMFTCVLKNTHDQPRTMRFLPGRSDGLVSVIAYHAGWMRLVADQVVVPANDEVKINVLIVNANHSFSVAHHGFFTFQATPNIR
jgi:hypothetical protein